MRINAQPLRLIDSIRRSHPSMKTIFMNGSCLHLYFILKGVFPDAVGFLHGEEHIVTKIDGELYDINGVFCPTKHLIHLRDVPQKILIHLADTSQP